jgi:hypothetical protein
MHDALRDKIEQLFEYRAFHELYRMSGASTSDLKKFHEQLVELQARIYDLDAYLESVWILQEKQLDGYWKKIYLTLEKLGITPDKHRDYTSQIHQYQKHEADLRDNLLPTRLSMEYFYFYKSCDVKLQRRLLLEHFPVLKQLFTLADWRFFDLVTEVNDDATDLEEDLSTINGNRLLISFYTKGLTETKQNFEDFLKATQQKSKVRFDNRNVSTFHKNIHYRTVEQINATLAIIQNPPKAILHKRELSLQNFLNLDIRA